MKVLGIDGALGEFSVAVAEGDRILSAATVPDKTALERGLGAIASTLRDAGISGEQLDRLAVGIGPGGFTGLRIALSYAKSLAQAWEKPLVPISSFDLLECGRDAASILTIVVGRPGIISVRLRHDGRFERASGRTEQAIQSIVDVPSTGADLPDPLPVLGAPPDVLAALAACGQRVLAEEKRIISAAACAALLAQRREPAPSVHEVRADYGQEKK